MPLDPATEARVFAKLVRRGLLEQADVAELFAAARAAGEAGEPVSLSSLALRRGLLDKSSLSRLLRTDGEDVPPIPGRAYVAKLGEGGTAHVFKVRDKDGDEQAVKILKSEVAADPAEVKAFLAEAKLLQRLDHENVVKGDQVGRLAGRYLFFMEHVDGRTLQECIEQDGAFEEESALSIILQVSRALEYLRGEGVVHRDVKPGNIMVTADDTVKLIDLGFALGNAGAGEQAAGTTRGTAAYLSPEQARGEADLDVRSDIYSLGATLYQMVLGELPFAGEDDEELVQQAVLAGLSAEATKGGRISAHMHYFIEKMMAKDRDVRYQSPEQLQADIVRQMQGKQSLAGPADDDGADDDDLARRRLDRMRRKRKRKR